MKFVSILLIFSFLAGCDPAAWTHVYLSPEVPDGPLVTTQLNDDEVSKALRIIESIRKEFKLNKGTMAAHAGRLAAYGMELKDPYKRVGLIVTLDNNKKMLVVQTYEMPSFNPSELVLDMQKKIIKEFSKEFGSERVNFD